MTVMETYKQEETVSDDHKLATLAHEYGTPLYVYDLQRLLAKVLEFRAALVPAGAELFFATMANDRPQILTFLAQAELGACVNSLPHLLLATDAGFGANMIQFTSTGITPDDMRVLLGGRFRCNLDSISQLEQWFRLGGTEAGLRINAASFNRGLSPDRIGTSASDLDLALVTAERMRGLIRGLHIYLGTNFQTPNDMLPTLEAFFQLAERVKDLCYLNIGGGVGINYSHHGARFDIEAFGNGLAELKEKLYSRTRRKIELIFEPGRSITAECGTFIAKVTDVKSVNGTRFASVDGSIAVFPRPFHHPNVPHRIRPVSNRHKLQRFESRGRKAYVVGRTTFSKDILGSAVLPEGLKPGDLLAFDDAGAYSQSMTSRFLGQPSPQECFLDISSRP